MAFSRRSAISSASAARRHHSLTACPALPGSTARAVPQPPAFTTATCPAMTCPLMYERSRHEAWPADPAVPLARRCDPPEGPRRVARRMSGGEPEPFYGKPFQQAEPLNSPAPISQPHPPILIGGGGERKTLRLVAQYADACNLFTRYSRHDLARKLDKLRRYCDEAGRSFDAIDRTCLGQWDPVRKSPQAIVDELGELAELGFTTAIASLRDVESLKPIEIVARDVLPQAERL